MHEILWHGRGGQGVVLAAQILAEAAYIHGFRGVTSAPTFGPERRGAPLTASTRIADEPVRTFSQVAPADITVILDPSLLELATGEDMLKRGGIVIINTPLKPEEVGIKGCFSVATVDAAGIAWEHHLSMGGAPIVNTPLLGGFCRASGLVSLESIEEGIKKKMPRSRAAFNFQAIKTAYERTEVWEGNGKD
ncbi:MAG: 2-oxoacid:acceptor oxidoreductase family protein [Deltaproteobacteria bacterium]|nr:2-oxoacid:acceptor oxidoreductase family protein [Deltaproteobacteria bacterium]